MWYYLYMEMNWKKGDLLFIRAHTFIGGKGLSYEAGVYEAAEDGFSGGWDVFDSTIDVSFYGFSVEKVQHKYIKTEGETMKVYVLLKLRSVGEYFHNDTVEEFEAIFETREAAENAMQEFKNTKTIIMECEVQK